MQDDVQAVVSGTVDTIIYQNEENGYTVCGIDTEDGDSLVLVGTIPFLTEGDRITAYGAYTNHATYGRQFKVASYEKHLPTETADILKYLASGAVRGIGPKTAARIILELKDKLGVAGLGGIESESGFAVTPVGDNAADAVSALLVLGYSRSEASAAIRAADPNGKSVEDIIKKALSLLMRQ